MLYPTLALKTIVPPAVESVTVSATRYAVIAARKLESAVIYEGIAPGLLIESHARQAHRIFTKSLFVSLDRTRQFSLIAAIN